MTPAALARPFQQVDVFTEVPLRGNPVAVVLDGTGLTTEQMQSFTDWTNLSEATFVLPPEDPQADYKLRIFCPGRELPFAGHPTLGSCHAWLRAGGRPRGEHVVQECGVGRVRIRRDGTRLAFAAPPLRRSGPLEDSELARIAQGLGLARTDIALGGELAQFGFLGRDDGGLRHGQHAVGHDQQTQNHQFERQVKHRDPAP